MNLSPPAAGAALQIVRSKSLTPVGNDTLSDRVYERLARALMTGELEPDSAITLRAAAELVGTSVMPVREAARRLMAQDALILKRNQAIRVPSLSPTEFEQLWHLREMLEGEACAQAAPIIEDEELAVLYKLVNEAFSAAKAQDMRPIIIKAHEFFFRIYRASSNSILVAMIEMLWLRTGPLYFQPLSSVNHLSFVRKSLQNNARLYEALKVHDADAAREIRQRDLCELADWFRRHQRGLRAPAAATPSGAARSTKLRRQLAPRRKSG